MRVTVNPGTYSAEERELSQVMTVKTPFDSRRSELVAASLGELIDLLVEKGVLDLADCQNLGGPHMEKVE